MSVSGQPSNTNSFTLFPAIDIYQGHCVRLFQGDYEARTEYSENPAQVAREFVEAGAKWLHVVDLDAAKSGTAENLPVIEQVVKICSKSGVQVQVGGGVRSREAIERLLALGITRCVIGTAVRDLTWMQDMATQFGGSRLVAGLDGRNGKLAVKGWTEQTEISLVDLGRELYALGVRTALVTDVAKDGTLTGPNLDLAAQVQTSSGLDVLASGGVSGPEDVLASRAAGLAGVIAGRALYDGRLDLKDIFSQLGVV
ncbi:1-(5-phosphoribosyl)-5-[(5-phosphoribosylamino)methylideneamino]imidazole-4-carboxamide isomerase [Alicyclobacillus sp. SO9]|uniref:1-(5-phosphoribosyl)-5-[(5- phosphoribosylamino)methylideneamino]imidazole-4- carboxamide isomerase n=1 Tax=Alicyclobacillus sp. SO9 TaxID=2665646 RepID=UPI0018E7632C|nr:1-(5-phosphoribosyl)-5-[(5-phosphoribosylamino)methylideneamino]imidazole-4-carboxamide isomerase [Alicyclobacillus sp. SO9]QQE80202.1 1-(5-phosphoribosyl)-5-[(5-phosphoribosylamino)methylideneamino]imidazole-4-carboxamide isomerase [Alicyclobacillus sp. SO9]